MLAFIRLNIVIISFQKAAWYTCTSLTSLKMIWSIFFIWWSDTYLKYRLNRVCCMTNWWVCGAQTRPMFLYWIPVINGRCVICSFRGNRFCHRTRYSNRYWQSMSRCLLMTHRWSRSPIISDQSSVILVISSQNAASLDARHRCRMGVLRSYLDNNRQLHHP